MIRVVRGTVDENAEEAAVGPRAAPRRSSSSTTTSRSRNAMDSSASEAASRVRTAMRSPRFRPTCVSSKSDAWDRILRGRRTAWRFVEDLRRTREDGPPGAPSNLDDSEAPSRPLDAALCAPPPPLPRPREPPAPSELLHLGVREVLRRPLRYLVLRQCRRSPPSFGCGRVGRRRM